MSMCHQAVPGDEIDQRVQFFARRLPEDVAGGGPVHYRGPAIGRGNAPGSSIKRVRVSGNGENTSQLPNTFFAPIGLGRLDRSELIVFDVEVFLDLENYFL